MATGLEVILSGSPSAPTIRLSGDADLATVTQLLEVLDSCSGHLLLDCTDLAFCDVTALNAMIAASDRLRSQGGSLTLRRPPHSLRLAMQALGIDGRLG